MAASDKLKPIFPVLTILMIAFIWGHSFMPADMSSMESGFISDMLRSIFGLGSNIEGVVRKCAHFTEYLILGMLICADTCVLLKRSFVPTNITIGLLVPMIDETIQLFAAGRSGQVTDVWLDFCGFVTGTVFGMIIYRIIKN